MIDIAIAALSIVGAIGLCAAGGLFARSLLPGAVPLVRRFAEATDPAAAARPRAPAYLRWLTVLWAVALLGAGGIALLRAASLLGWTSSPRTPGLAGPSAVLLALFFGERLLRRWMFGGDAVSSVREQWQGALRILRDDMSALLVRRDGPITNVPACHPVATGRLDRCAILWRDRHCTLDRLLAASQALVPRLPAGERVLIACDDRALFIWAVLATWAARRTVVMPPPDLKLCTESDVARPFDCMITDRVDTATPEVARLCVTSADLAAAVTAPASATASAIALPDDHVAALFFTSGSTGEPTLQVRRWSQLAVGADAMASLLAMRDVNAVLGGTVVHSHMFGFEMLVMQVLRGSAAMYAHRIVYPSDLADFCALPGRCWLVSTPYHLRMLADAGPLPRGLERVISATSPLDAALALRVEQATGGEVHEIYGSTEAGCIATRRTTQGPHWRLAPDLQLLCDGQQGTARLVGARVGGQLQLRDNVEPVEGGFALLGRDTDLVKVAGKRTSLQALSSILCSIDGVEEGTFIDGGALGQTRLAAVVVAPRLGAARVRDALAARIDAAFLPRPLVMLAELPRDANGKLRHDALLVAVKGARRRPVPAAEPVPQRVQ